MKIILHTLLLMINRQKLNQWVHVLTLLFPFPKLNGAAAGLSRKQAMPSWWCFGFMAYQLLCHTKLD